MPEFLVRLLLGLLFIAVRVQFWPLCKLMGYRRFEPKPDSVLVTCCTNGLGHVHQMERVLGVLEGAGLNFPVIALASEKKVHCTPHLAPRLRICAREGGPPANRDPDRPLDASPSAACAYIRSVRP
jgi:hypothetical protein